jgi:hypothetical protein
MADSQTTPTDEQLFLTLVTDLITQAWVALGKWKHPVTDKMERNITAAGIIIDMLDMLNRKTVGNRTEAEDRLLVDSLQQLKLNYLTEVNKPEEPAEEAAEPPDTDKQAAPEAGQIDPSQDTESHVEAPAKKAPATKKKTAAKKTPKKTSGKPKTGQSSKASAQEKHDTKN